MAIALFVLGHWYLSLFSQSFFLHRYSAHKMFQLSAFWEKFFYIFTFVSQGSSFLNPRAYAIMHRMHHAFSDTDKDPHSPHFFKDVFRMMWHTKRIYMSFVKGLRSPEKEFDGNCPRWNALDKISDSWVIRVSWGALYFVFYYFFVPPGYEWLYALLPIHFLMGPIHGAIVNWCGHKYGYENFNNRDHSKNSLAWDFLMLGELFQNNHHKYPNSANFAQRWFELDPTYPIMRLLDWMKVIKLKNKISSE